MLLWSEIANYSSSFDSNVFWAGDASIEISTADITGSEIVTLINDAISNYVSSSGSGSKGTIGVYADYGGVGWTDGHAFAQGVIYEITVGAGETFGTPTGDLTVTASGYTPPLHSPWDTTGCTYKIGTGNSKPTGDPRGWSGNIVAAGTSGQTIQDEALSRYVWICCAISPWSGQTTDLSTPRGMQTTLTISDLKE